MLLQVEDELLNELLNGWAQDDNDEHGATSPATPEYDLFSFDDLPSPHPSSLKSSSSSEFQLPSTPSVADVQNDFSQTTSVPPSSSPNTSEMMPDVQHCPENNQSQEQHSATFQNATTLFTGQQRMQLHAPYSFLNYLITSGYSHHYHALTVDPNVQHTNAPPTSVAYLDTTPSNATQFYQPQHLEECAQHQSSSSFSVTPLQEQEQQTRVTPSLAQKKKKKKKKNKRAAQETVHKKSNPPKKGRVGDGTRHARFDEIEGNEFDTKQLEHLIRYMRAEKLSLVLLSDRMPKLTEGYMCNNRCLDKSANVNVVLFPVLNLKREALNGIETGNNGPTDRKLYHLIIHWENGKWEDRETFSVKLQKEDGSEAGMNPVELTFYQYHTTEIVVQFQFQITESNKTRGGKYRFVVFDAERVIHSSSLFRIRTQFDFLEDSVKSNTVLRESLDLSRMEPLPKLKQQSTLFQATTTSRVVESPSTIE